MQTRTIAAVAGLVLALGLSPARADQQLLSGGTNVQLTGTLAVSGNLSLQAGLPILFNYTVNPLTVMTNSNTGISLSYPLNQQVQLQVVSPTVSQVNGPLDPQGPIGCNFYITTTQTINGLFTRITTNSFTGAARCSVSPDSGGAGFQPQFRVIV